MDILVVFKNDGYRGCFFFYFTFGVILGWTRAFITGSWDKRQLVWLKFRFAIGGKICTSDT